MVPSVPFRLKVRMITVDDMQQYNQTSFHRHELIFTKKPITLVFDNTEVTLSANHIAILPSHLARKILLPSPSQSIEKLHFGYILSISDQYLASIADFFVETPEINHLFDEPHVLHYSYKTWQHLLQLMDNVYHALNDIRDDISRKLIFSMTAQLFLETYAMVESPHAERLNLDEREQLAYDIKRYVEQYYVKDIMISEIADLFNVSTSTINRLFHTYFNSTLYHFILELRLQAAHQYIEEGYSVTESWKRSGFNDYSNFYRAFIKHFNYRPHETPKQH